jgi:hypothetical protein
VYITVLDPAREDFKTSAQNYLARADVVVLHQGGNAIPRWKQVTPDMLQGRPVFRIVPPAYVTGELVGFVANRLTRKRRSPA